MRWNIEVDFRTIKATLQMDVLRCKSKEMIEKEIAIYLLADNLVRYVWAILLARIYEFMLAYPHEIVQNQPLMKRGDEGAA